MINTEFDEALIWFGLLFGFTGLLLHSYLIIDAAQHTGVVFPKWVTQIDYNFYGEGPLEILLFPFATIVSGYATYRYAVDMF